jgi:signal transduction histidine kinase
MNLLIVDDLETNRKLLRVTLEAEGHRILEAADGEEALVVLGHEKVDAVVSDILMPNMDGFAFCRRVREDKSLCDLPILVYTSTYKSSADEQLAKMVGANSYLRKPASTQTLIKILQELVTSNSRGTNPVIANDDSIVMRKYNAVLVHKLEEKNGELEKAQTELQENNRLLIQHGNELKQLNFSLEDRVARRTSDLEVSNRELMHANREIQSFYHTLSHELKTPLTSAREFICIVLDGLAGPVNETQTEYLGFVRESCDQLRTCIDDLFDAARLETGKLSVDFARGSMDALARRVIAVMQPMAAQKKIRLAVEAPAELPEVAMDEARMVQVLTNLLNNALKFTPEGGDITVKLHLEADHPELLLVSVSDTGPGMAADQLERIFNRLYQIQRGDAASQLGFGLGLYLCRELVALHGGEIRVESEVGKGSTFAFTIPLEQAVRGPFVLVVDDEEATRSFVERVLNREGFQVRAASDGSEALQSMQTQLPSLVILDLEMPGMNGVATLREIRKRWGLLPVIVHTGYPDGQMMIQALEFSPFTLLAKPSDVKKLLATVHGIKRQTDTDRASESDFQNHPVSNHVAH